MYKDEDTAATPADWRLYRLRKHLTLFELAGLVHGQDPARLKAAMHSEYMRAVSAALSAGLDGRKPPDATELPLHQSVRRFLDELRTATGERSDDARLATDEATCIATALGRTWPPELESAGAHQVARFCQGGTAAPTADRPANSASTRSRFDTIQIEIDDEVAALEGEGKCVTAATVMPLLKAKAGRADSCISATARDGVIWIRGTTGEPEKLTMAALKRRIRRTLRTPTGSQGR